MKRMIAAIISGIMVLALCGCGQTNGKGIGA